MFRWSYEFIQHPRRSGGVSKERGSHEGENLRDRERGSGLDLTIYPAPHSAPARMPGVYAQSLYARTHTSGRTKSVQDAPTTNDHDCTDAEPTKHTQPITTGKGLGVSARMPR